MAGDLDGTPYTTQLSVNSATGAATVTTIDLATATLTFQERVTIPVEIAALGTAETRYVTSPIAGTITRVDGVSNANGAGSGGTSTITVTVDSAAVATLPFLQDYVAGNNVNDSSIAAHALSAGEVITVATDGTGSHTGKATVFLTITPS